MPNIVKVREHSSTSDKVIHHETSADIVKVDNSKLTTITGSNVQDIITSIDESIKDVSTYVTEFTLTTKINTKNFNVSDGHYTQKITLDGIKENDNPIIGLVLSDDINLVSDEMEAWGCIQRVTCGDGFITVHCYDDTPLVDINIQLKVIH